MTRERVFPKTRFLVIGTLLSILYGIALVVLRNLTHLAIYDELLVLFLIPVFYAAFHCNDRVYLAASCVTATVSFWVIYNVVPDILSSVQTLVLVFGTTVIASEMIFRAMRKRRHAEESLLFTQFAIDRAGEPAFWMGPDARFIYVNEAAARSLGYSKEEFLTMSVHDIDPWFPVEAWPKHWEKIKQRRFFTFESCHRRKNGDVFPVEITVNYFEFGNKEYSCTFARDITERKQAEETLRESEERHRTVVENTSDFVWRMDLNGRFTFASPAAKRMFGYDPAELLGQPFEILVTPESAQKARTSLENQQCSESCDEGVTLELIHSRKDGSEFTGETRTMPLFDPNVITVEIVGVTRDIADRKRAEDALRQSEERYRTVVDNASDVVWRMDMNGRMTFLSQAVKQMFGYEPEELLGKPFNTILTDESVRQASESLARRKRGELGNEGVILELVHRHKNGKEFVAETRSAPVLGPDGQPVEIGGITRDITDRKHLEGQLRQVQKMEAIGQLAGGVAHDFNNLLTVIIGNLDLADRGAPPEIRKFLTTANKATTRAEELVDQLLAFGRKSTIDLSPVNLNEIVQEVHRLARETIDRRIEIETHTEENLPNILGDAAQINSVLMNLCVNARDAVEEVMHGRATPERYGDRFAIRIETESALIDDHYCSTYTYAQPGHFVVVSVSDNGAGMTAEIQQHIFEPFFTTKQVGKGTGLGLASCYGVIKQHNGWINTHSELGKGTTFKIYLPVAEETTQNIGEEPFEEIRGGKETILLVDDEEMIRDLGKMTLEEYGYTVLLAADGEEALDIYLKEPDRIDLIILDLSMPHLSGQEMLERLYSASPGVRVIISTGYDRGPDTASPKRLRPAGYVSKPYSPDGLARTVREVLDTPSPA
ncbi:MAG: PAS domain S-box protein [bacterium]